MPRNQTRGTIKIQNPKDMKMTWNKETQMTGQHEPLCKSEMKSAAPERTMR